jgi:hypothetical protein
MVVVCFVCWVVAERDQTNPNRFRLEEKSHEKTQILFVALIINDLGAILFYSVSQTSRVLECFALEVGNVRVHDLAGNRLPLRGLSPAVAARRGRRDV